MNAGERTELGKGTKGIKVIENRIRDGVTKEIVPR
jgi:hypothetical protein